MQSVESKILKVPLSVTAGQPPECEQSNGDSFPQLEVLRGRDGRDGERGIPGERGEKGERGPIGYLGARGPLGLVGEKGQPGEKGERGSVGLSGATGAQGQKGANGQKGQQGERGERGERGEIGQKGLRGDRGQLGTRGTQEQKGEPGERGLTGPAGSAVNCGQTYVRWGRTNCPGNQSTELVYSGRAGGSRHDYGGGATNYLCMSDNPDYIQYNSRVQGTNYIYPEREEERMLYRPHTMGWPVFFMLLGEGADLCGVHSLIT